MAFAAVFFSFPAALIGALYLSATTGIGAVEALGVYSGLGLLMLVVFMIFAAIIDRTGA